MSGRNIFGIGVLVIVGVVPVGLIPSIQRLPEAEQIPPEEKTKDEKAKKNPITVDVVIEEVDFSANTITARATTLVVPPHDNVGGLVFTTGTTNSQKDKATKYVRLPVMPEANLKAKKPKAGEHSILRLEILQPGSLVVVGIEEFTGPEQIGKGVFDSG